MCVLHLHDKRCSLGIHKSLAMIVTSFTLRSPCSWKLPCEMYVLQFYYLNLFSVVLTQLRLKLRCRCIDASTSTPPHLSTCTSSHAHIRRTTSPPHHTHTSAHLYHICTSTLSLLHICPAFLSFFLSFFLSRYLFSRLCAFTSSHAHIHRSPTPYTYRSISHLHIHTVTPSHPPSLSLFLYIFSTVLDNYMSRSRANRRLVCGTRCARGVRAALEDRGPGGGALHPSGQGRVTEGHRGLGARTLLGAPAIATRSKDATRGSWPYY